MILKFLLSIIVSYLLRLNFFWLINYCYVCFVVLFSRWVNIVEIGVVGGRLDHTVAVDAVQCRTGSGPSGNRDAAGKISTINESGGSLLTIMILTNNGHVSVIIISQHFHFRSIHSLTVSTHYCIVRGIKRGWVEDHVRNSNTTSNYQDGCSWLSMSEQLKK